MNKQYKGNEEKEQTNHKAQLVEFFVHVTAFKRKQY